jgi:hypothetical protein
MGAQASHEIPADLSLLPSFKKVSAPVQTYFQLTSDGILAMGSCITAMAEKIDASVASYLTPEEKTQFNQLLADKVKCVDLVDKFVRAEKLRYARMCREVKPGVSLAHLVRNSHPDNQTAEIDKLIDLITATRQGFKTFSDELKENCKNDSRGSTQFQKAVTGCCAGIATFVVGISFAAAIICHFIPGVNFVMFASDFILGATVFAACAATAIVCLRQDELQRAQAYLASIEDNLRKLKTSVQDLGADDAHINDEMDAEEMKILINSIIGRCDKILGMNRCDAANPNLNGL